MPPARPHLRPRCVPSPSPSPECPQLNAFVPSHITHSCVVHVHWQDNQVMDPVEAPVTCHSQPVLHYNSCIQHRQASSESSCQEADNPSCCAHAGLESFGPLVGPCPVGSGPEVPAMLVCGSTYAMCERGREFRRTTRHQEGPSGVEVASWQRLGPPLSRCRLCADRVPNSALAEPAGPQPQPLTGGTRRVRAGPAAPRPCATRRCGMAGHGTHGVQQQRSALCRR